jgi:hypothetical protein
LEIAVTVNSLVLLVHVLVAVFAFDLARRLAMASGARGQVVPVALVIGLAFGSTLLNAYLPPLVAARESLFILQPAWILAMIGGLWLAGASGAGRRVFVGLDPRAVLRLYAWRAVFGAMLLILGLSGGLPTGFFWSAGIGDIAVGLWAIAIAARFPGVSRTELLAWNAAGLVDLIHVLALGASVLRLFYEANPEIARLTLLPFFGVPAFIALHLLLFPVLAKVGSPSRIPSP